MELYIHIPYCRQKCRYCDFASWAGRESSMQDYVDALLKEAEAMACHTVGVPLQTAFIGGGTPSMLPPGLMRQLLDGIRAHYRYAADMEFTTEANPGTLTAQWLDTVVAGGVNRLSLGMQAYQPELLRTLGRIHTHEQVIESVRLAQSAGVNNISLDLMFGLPGQTPQMWRDTLTAALELQPDHLSCYGLIPEDGTPLKDDLDRGRLTLPDEEDERRMYDDALSILDRSGFRQYEISNFARPGCECRHNIGYWRQIPYIGLGASAASMLRSDSCELRLANPADIGAYIGMVRRSEWHLREETVVSPEDMQFETLMLGLRMTEGVRVAGFEALHGMGLEIRYGKTLRRLESEGLMIHEDGCWRLSRRGMDVQNAILVELMDE